MRLYNPASSFRKWGFWSQQVVIHLPVVHWIIFHSALFVMCIGRMKIRGMIIWRWSLMMTKRLRKQGMAEMASMVRMALEHIMGFWNLVQLFLYLGTCLRLKFSLGPLSWYLQHRLPALPSLILLLFVNSYCPTPSPCFLWHLSSYVMSNSIIFAFNFDTSLWLNHTRIYDLK